MHSMIEVTLLNPTSWPSIMIATMVVIKVYMQVNPNDDMNNRNDLNLIEQHNTYNSSCLHMYQSRGSDGRSS